MEKLLTFPGKIGNDIFMYSLEAEAGHLTKTASQYHPEIAAYINDAKKMPGKTQLLLTALGAGEFWGPNVNGDWFGENDLAHPGPEYGYKTFESMAKGFKHHQNKPTDPSYGEVVLSVYNPVYHRVELIVAVDNESGKDIVEKMNNGDYPEWSMGCRVKYDICSICKNHAKNRTEYCSHLKYYIGRIDPESGKHVYAINPKPKFFDISYVLIGADKTAKTHLKVARALGARNPLPITGSAELAEKRAEIEKQVKALPGEDASSLMSMSELEAVEEMKSREEDLPLDIMDNMASKAPLSKVLSTLMMLGIQPKPHEVQRLVMVNAGQKALADKMSHMNVCFDPDEEIDVLPSAKAMISNRNFDPGLAKSLYSLMPQRSIYNPHVTKRILIMIKSMPEPAPAPTLIKVGKVLGKDLSFNPGKEDRHGDNYSMTKAMGLMALAAMIHSALNKKAPVETMTGLERVVAENPGMAAAVGLGGAAVFNQLLKPSSRGHGEDKSFKMESEMPDMANGSFAFKKSAKASTELSKAVAGIAGTRLLSSGLNRSYRTDPGYQEGKLKRFVRKNPEVVQAAVFYDALRGMSGGGSSQMFRNARKKVAPFLKKFAMEAKKQNASLEAQNKPKPAQKPKTPNSSSSTKDLLSSAVVWPLAFGRTGASVRMVGGLVDQYAISKLTNRMSKKKDGKN